MYRYDASGLFVNMQRAARVALLGLALLGVVAPVRAAPVLPLVLSLNGPARVEAGVPVTLTLSVRGQAALGGFEATLLFAGEAAHLNGLVQRANDLHAWGREVVPLGPTAVSRGERFGLVSCPGPCREPRPIAAPAHEGAVRLATLEIVPDQEGVLELRLGSVRVVDDAGNVLPLAGDPEVLRVQVGESGVLHTSPPDIFIPERPLETGSDSPGSVTNLMEAALQWESDVRAGVSAPSVAALQQRARNLQPLPTPPTAGVAPALTFLVNSVGDGPDSHIGNGTCETEAGDCTLRAAIHESNAQPGPNTIGFNIPGDGPHIIHLTRPLTTLNDASGPTTIDGYTQPGSTPNNAVRGSNAVLRIGITGPQEAPIDGLRITTPGNTVRGLALFGLSRTVWLYGSEAAENRVIGNWIGTDPTATFVACCESSTAHGVLVDQGAHDNWIGGTALGERNVISGNGFRGVGLWFEGTDRNRVVNNVVGLSPDGTRRLPNLRHGVDINFGARDNLIGGTGPAERNVLSGNGWAGVQISHNAGTRGNRVAGNFVGTDLTGTHVSEATANRYSGIWLDDGVQANLIHHNVVSNSPVGSIVLSRTTTAYNQVFNNWVGIAPDDTPLPSRGSGIVVEGNHNVVGPHNRVAYQGGAAIMVSQDDGDFNTLTRNALFSTGGLAIDLGPLGVVNPNDLGDEDTGPNEGLNMPVITSATHREVQGEACAGCTVEVFVAAPEASGHGGARAWLASGTAGPDGTFAVRLTGIFGAATITATATDPQGNTSEFAENVVVLTAPGPEPCCQVYLPLIRTNPGFELTYVR